jgi:hypothetical protein
MNLLEDRAISITAVLYPMSSGFSLNFDINRKFTRTYLLEEIGMCCDGKQLEHSKLCP